MCMSRRILFLIRLGLPEAALRRSAGTKCLLDLCCRVCTRLSLSRRHGQLCTSTHRACIDELSGREASPSDPESLTERAIGPQDLDFPHLARSVLREPIRRGVHVLSRAPHQAPHLGRRRTAYAWLFGTLRAEDLSRLSRTMRAFYASRRSRGRSNGRGATPCTLSRLMARYYRVACDAE